MSALLAVLVSLTIARGNVGKRFDSIRVKNIKQGLTKKSEILDMFGLPFKEGEQNGKATWTYQHNQYSAFDEGRYEDLVILFNKGAIVESYRYTSSAPRR